MVNGSVERGGVEEEVGGGGDYNVSLLPLVDIMQRVILQDA